MIISVYRNVYDRRGARGDLGVFLALGARPRWQELFRRIRTALAEGRADQAKQYKKLLPQAAVSGLFEPTRSCANLVSHSGLICLDLDYQDNADHPDFDRLIAATLSRLPWVRYAASSVSGRGYFAIVPIASGEHHRAHFRALQTEFSRLGLRLDPACSDPTRLRTLAPLEGAYSNPEALVYHDRIELAPLPPRHTPVGDDREYLERAVRRLEAQHRDITATYSDWYTVGAALASLGEEGRSYFHRVSALNPAYNRAATDRKFNALLRTPTRITLGSFFYKCSV